MPIFKLTRANDLYYSQGIGGKAFLQPRQDEQLETATLKADRIVANIAASDIEKAHALYNGIFGLELIMNHGWIRTYGSKAKMTVQISFASEGGSGTPVPDFSIEVDDLEIALKKVKEAMIPIAYGPAEEPWGVRRFYVKDPFGTLVNVLQHDQSSAS